MKSVRALLAGGTVALAAAASALALPEPARQPEPAPWLGDLPRCRGAAASEPALSADGRFLAFRSSGTGARRRGRILLRDLRSGRTWLVSRASGDASSPSVSADGRFVAFASSRQVFVRDQRSRTTVLVSRAALDPSISADGRFVAFASDARDPSRRDGPGTDVFVRDLRTHRTRLVSAGLAPTRHERVSTAPAISADGRHVAFESRVHAKRDDDSTFAQIYVRDLMARTTRLVSRGSGPRGYPGDYWSHEPSISRDGARVVFTSAADNLSPAKPPSDSEDLGEDGYNSVWYYEGAFLRDLRKAATELVSRADGPDGAGATDSDGLPVTISADGRFAAFTSADDRMVGQPEAGGKATRVLVRDIERGRTTLVSSGRGVGSARAGSLSGDGRLVAFTSNRRAVFVHDRLEQRTVLASGQPC